MAFSIKKQANLNFKKNTTLKIPRTGIQTFLPSSLGGLSLWLKADTGVSKFSYNYISQIVISGTSNPSFAGTYTANTVPVWSFDENAPENYILTGPNEKFVNYEGGNFELVSAGNSSFVSANGETWSAVNPYVSQVIITGFTGIYAGANGTYNVDAPYGDYFERVGGGFYISGNGLFEANEEVLIATNTNNYQGAWTPATFINQVTLSGAGSSYVNGVYTRTSPGLLDDASFSGPTTLIWYAPENSWWLGSEAYYSNNLLSWYVFNTGASPVPTAIVTTAPKPVGSPTSTTVFYPSGSISGSVTLSTVDTNNVIEWEDQSGNGNNAIPVNNNPIYNISDLNGKPTISLTSMSDDGIERVFTISSNPLGVGGSTAFSVQYVEDVCNFGDDNGPVFGNFGGSEDTYVLAQTHYPYGPDCFVYDAFGTRLRKNEITPPVTITNAWTLYSVKSTDNDWQSFANSQLMHSDPTNTYSSAIGGDDTVLYIGKQTANGTYRLKGKVAEVIVYNRVLTTIERQQVEAYLNEKYAIY